MAIRGNRNESPTMRDTNTTLRTGLITEIDPKKMLVRVKFEDLNLGTWTLQIMQHNSLKNKHYWLPDLNELVVCMIDQNSETGYVIGTLYNEKDEAPEDNKDVRALHFADDTYVRYNREEHKLELHCEGTIEIWAKKGITIHTEEKLIVSSKDNTEVSSEEKMLLNSSDRMHIESTEEHLVTKAAITNCAKGMFICHSGLPGGCPE